MHLPKDFFVVGIGASAGGLDAIQQLFDHIPEDTGMAFVIVQHLSPDFKSLMPELLAKHTKMKIFTAEDKQLLEPNCIYLNQKNKNLHLKGCSLHLTEKSPKPNLNLPIDIFFHTLGEEFNENAVGVILSGTGSDGSRGIKTIKEAGGTLIVQTPDSAQFDGMPNSAIGTNLVDYILDPEKIAETIGKIQSHRLEIDKKEFENRSNEIIFYKILDEIHRTSSIDFKQYKKNTLLRRLEKRMNITNFEKLYDYHIYIKSNPNELRALRQDFLIGVTSFFRDVEAFENLKNIVIPEICHSRKGGDDPIRVWVPGCSTGEEVFTIAILLDDYIASRRMKVDYKIFATDIDDRALETAGAAIYSHNAMSEIMSEYIDAYFVTEDNDRMRVIKRVRERIVFSQHNLLKDPPFIRMDLISCRNLLIYLESAMQRKVLMNFQFALNKNGYMFLGSSESLGKQDKFFKVLNSKWKIFQCISDTTRMPMQNVAESRVTTVTIPPTHTNSKKSLKYHNKENPENIFYKCIGQRFSPAVVFVDASFQILFVKGDITTRLSVREGFFESNLLKIVNNDIVPILRSGLRKVKDEGKDVIVKDVVNQVGETKYCFDLGFHKPTLDKNQQQIFMVYFSNDKQVDNTEVIQLNSTESSEIQKQQINLLESELNETKSELQNVVEELETSNEELQSSNEELMASNEELQSTNEELQSVNEELYTVNAELQEKNRELSYLNNDINNLLNSTEIGTLFLDVDLRIRKFTPTLKTHFNLKDEDEGRTISSFASNFEDDDRKSLINDCAKSLDNLVVVEENVCNEDGRCYLRRISPFITSDKKIEGVVITFVDISELKEATRKLTESETLFKSIYTNAGIGIATISNTGKALSVNPELENILGYSEEEIKSKRFVEFVHSNDLEIEITRHQQLFNGEIDTYKIDKRFVRKNGDVVWGQLTVTAVLNSEKEVLYAVALVKDITHQKIAAQILQESETKFKTIFDILEVGLTITDESGNIIDCNKASETILGISKEEHLSRNYAGKEWNIIREDGTPMPANEFASVRAMAEDRIVSNLIMGIVKANDEITWISASASPLRLKGYGVLVGYVDITNQVHKEKQLVDAKKKAEVASIYKNQFLANMSHEIRTPMNGVVGFADLLNKENLTPESRSRYVDIIKSSSNQLLNLINDIIDVSKIEAGEMQLDLTTCNFTKLFENLDSTFNEIKKQKGKDEVQIITIIPDGELLIKTDCLRIQQVISNLLGNALKFTDSGTIKFGYEINEDKIHVFVNDQGIGMPKDKLNHIFNRFEQIEQESDRNKEGTGLGLFISKSIVELLGGEIGVESALHVGTSFWFNLPLIAVDEDMNSTEEALEPMAEVVDFNDGLTLLLVEDDPINVEFFKSLFMDYPFKVIVAENGQQAVEIYNDKAGIDLVLMDIRMPIMDGLDAAKHILAKFPDAKIIAQTAYAMSDDESKYKSQGFIDYITKPINKDVLLALIAKHIN